MGEGKKKETKSIAARLKPRPLSGLSYPFLVGTSTLKLFTQLAIHYQFLI